MILMRVSETLMPFHQDVLSLVVEGYDSTVAAPSLWAADANSALPEVDLLTAQAPFCRADACVQVKHDMTRQSPKTFSGLG